ncbi:MAG: protein kinase [Pseudomonadota bacterium]
MIGARPGDTFQPGDLLNNTYRVEAVLGRGGTSEVYRARSEISGRPVAVKALKAEFAENREFLALLTREEEIREIRHEAVVRYSENHRTSDGKVYLVMDYIDGPRLDERMRQGGLPMVDLLTIAGRVASGLKAAHAQNIVHRDLSPDNIILRNGSPAEAVIIDFGIAKDETPGAETIVGQEFAGKYSYAAPEQMHGQTDARSDLYSLGALLLAAFRGERPDAGRNPMEVVKRKEEPLDTAGVPEPLKSIIDKLSDPAPEKRFQSAQALLDALGPGAVEEDDETTIVAPPPGKKPKKPPAKSGRGGLIAVVGVVVLLAAGGAGAAFMGLIPGIGPSRLPLADPFTLVINNPRDAAPTAQGVVPTEEMVAELTGFMDSIGGTAEVSAARGPIAETWGDDVLTLLETVEPLSEWTVTLENDTASLSALAENRDTRAAVLRALSGGMPGALSGPIEIVQGPVILPVPEVDALLRQFADCGPLRLVSPPTETGYAMDDTISVAGRLSSQRTRVALADAILAVAGDRQLVIDTALLNPALCAVDVALPAAPSGGLSVDYSFGGDGATNPSGTFKVGDNPVIDIIIPGDVTTGYLSVSVVDVSGNVFHLLPNIARPDNAVEVLRDGRTGAVPVRVAFSQEEAAGTSLIAFLVDSSALGTSRIIAVHSDTPLFDGLRPTTESAGAYAEALRFQTQNNPLAIRSVDTELLITTE